MGCDDITFAQLLDGPNDGSILGEQTVSHAVDALGIAGGQALLEQLHPMLADQYLPFRGTLQADEQRPNAFGLFVHPMD